MDFGLVGAKRRNKSGVGHNTSFWDVGIGPEEYCIHAGGHVRANALCKSAEIVGNGADPHVFVGSMDKMAIIKGSASDFVDDGIAFAVAVLLISK